MKKYYILVFSCIFMHQFSLAQFTNDTTANYIIRDSLGTEQLTPLTATTSTGRTYISWFDSNNSNFELRMQLLDANGNKLWPAEGLVVSSYSQSTALFRYDLKVDRENNAIVAFQDTRFVDLKVVAYKVDQGGNLVWGTTGVELSDSSAEGLSPTICVTHSNDVIIAWNSDIGSSKWISYQKISAAGNLLWSQRIFDNANINKFSRAVMTPFGLNDFMMMYVQEVGSFPGVTSTLFTQHFDTNGDAVWTLPVQVSTKTIPYFVFPPIVSDGRDGFFVAFNTSNPVNISLNDVYAQHVDSAGNLWSATGTEVANSTTEHKSTGGFCFNESNNELYVCLQVLDGGQGSSGVFIQGLDSTGAVLFGANGIQLKNIDPVYYNPHALVDAGNGLITIFSYGGFGTQKLAAVKTDYTGILSWGYEPTICNYNSNKDDLSAGLFMNDQTVIVWMDDRLDAGIYTQNISGDGTFGIFTGVTKKINPHSIALYPNPSSSAKLIYTSAKSGEVILSITNMEGKECSLKTYPVTSGRNEISLEEKNLSDGVYLISLISEDGISYVKWVKK